MATSRQIRATVDLCVAIMGRYNDSGRTRRDTILMTAEIQAVSAWVRELGLSPKVAEYRIQRPARAELVRRHGENIGVRFEDEFVAASEHLDSAIHLFEPVDIGAVAGFLPRPR